MKNPLLVELLTMKMQQARKDIKASQAQVEYYEKALLYELTTGDEILYDSEDGIKSGVIHFIPLSPKGRLRVMRKIDDKVLGPPMLLKIEKIMGNIKGD